MSFDHNKFKIIGSNNDTSPTMWSYETNDIVSDVLATGYFTDPRAEIKAGDYIIINSQDGSGFAIASSTESAVEAPADYSGWAEYADTVYTEVSPWQPTTDTWSDVPNNAGSTLDFQSPLDIGDMYDSAGGKITGRNGDGVLITIEFIAKPTENFATFLDTAFFIGDNLGPFADGRIYQRTLSFPKGQNVARVTSFTVGGYTLGTWEANGAKLQMNPSRDIDIYLIRYIITRTHKAR